MRRLAAAAAALSLSSAALAQPTNPNLTYAVVGGRALQLDLYAATAGNPPYPLVVYIHGGGWQGGSRAPIPAYVGQLRARGVSVASVTYRLTSQEGQWGGEPVTFPAQIHDVKGAVRWLRANAGVYNLDPTRFGVWGPSAGGHLSALLAVSAGVSDAEGSVGGNLAFSSAVQACVDYFGPTDLINMAPDITDPPGGQSHDVPNSGISRLLGWDEPGQGVGDIRANIDNPNPPYPDLVALINLASSINHVDPSDPPTFVAHGTEDTTVPINQSVRLRDALAAANVPHIYRPVQGAGHGGFPQIVHMAALDFIVARLTAPAPCAADLDGDGVVAAADLAALLGSWGLAGPTDLNASGSTGADDLAAMLGAWGPCS